MRLQQMTRVAAALVFSLCELYGQEPDGKLFADFTSGDGWSVQVAIQNNSLERSLQGVLLARDDEAAPLDIFGPLEPTSLFGGVGIKFEIPRGGTAIYQSPSEGELVRGTILVLLAPDSSPFDENILSTVLTYRHLETGMEVSVTPFDTSKPVFGTEQAYSVFVEETAEIGTGLSLWKSPTNEVCLRLYDENGNAFVATNEYGYHTICYFPAVIDQLAFIRRHRAAVLPEWFRWWDFTEGFRGRLVIWVRDKTSGSENDGYVFGQALRFSKNPNKPSLSAIPWTPILDSLPTPTISITTIASTATKVAGR